LQLVMTRRLLATALAFTALLPATAVAQDPPPGPPMPGSFEQLGHEPLMNRGMNAALAVFGGYAYVGSRTDGSHANSGIMVVDVKDPTKPTVVDEIGPERMEGLPTQTSGREMRILPDQKLLIVANHSCSEAIHRCASANSTGASALPSNYNIFDIAGENAASPKLLYTYEPTIQGAQVPHEWFVWTDPKRPSRTLLYMTDPGGDPQLVVADISRIREGEVKDIAKFSAESGSMHSISLSNDGKRLYLSMLTGGFQEADTSEIASGKADPQIKPVTPGDQAPTWEGPGAHTSVPLPGRPDSVMVTDEVYAYVPGLLNDHGCPWGWVRFIDSSKPQTPQVISEYRLPWNDPKYCESVSPFRNSTASFASHNPTMTENLAILTWHSGGLQAIDTTNPAAPAGAAQFFPEPLPAVQTEDPILSSGTDKVVMWSYPVIVDGLIYVVDLRNGLYILRYKGPHQDQVSRVKFLDGNTNTGDIQRMEPAPGAVASKPNAVPGVGPAVGGPSPCLPSPLRLRGSAVGPFRAGDTRTAVELRGGPPSAVRKTSLTYCVDGGGKVSIAFKGTRARLVGVTSGRVTGAALTPGSAVRKLPRGYRRAGRGGLVMKRGKKTSVVARVRGGKVAFVGVALGRPKTKDLARLVKSAGL
jgi:hypothetical protein